MALRSLELLVAQDEQFLDDLTRLRADALIMLGWITGAISYLSLIFLLWPVTGAHSTPVSWLGTMVLMAVSLLAILDSRRHQRMARYSFATGVHVAAACGMITLAEPTGAYLFLLPIIFASVLFNRWLALANALIAITLIILLNPLALGFSLWAAPPLLSVAITAITAVASWLAAHNLYTALTWLSGAYTNAYNNERLARERQAELQRVLKALDEAHYRLRRLNGLLVSARDEAEEGKRIKQYFAQTISHELRTPLNLVVGFAELMIESPEFYGSALPSSYLRDLRIIYRNARHLQGLVNDVLDLARIESAQMSLILARVDPDELTCEAVETVRSLIESRGLTLTTHIAADLPPIWLDATRIRQVLINLLNNAARFTPRGGVKVSVQQADATLRFDVSDTGIGIPPADLSRIFDEFYQVDGGSNRRQEGAGLGLAISRKFVGLHGGKMWAESVEGQGSTFSFALPLAPTTEMVSHTSDSSVLAANNSDLAPVRDFSVINGAAVGRDSERVLLVVTQSNSAVGMLSRYLPQYRVLAASELAQAQTLARQVIPQALILDTSSVALSDAQLGAELAELGRAWGLLQVPIISCPLPGGGPLSRRLAVDGYLIKPVARQNLWDVVRGFGESVEQILIVDDNRDFVRLLRQMLANPLRPYRIESAYSGEEALANLRLSPPDLILLDLGLPDLNGVQLVEILRAHPILRSIPIVVVSAQDELDGLEVLHGALMMTKAGGLLPGDLIRWLNAFMGTPQRSPTWQRSAP
jgi:signal transduction histidine kinase/CheY-like chemotaxis protein